MTDNHRLRAPLGSVGRAKYGPRREREQPRPYVADGTARLAAASKCLKTATTAKARGVQVK